MRCATSEAVNRRDFLKTSSLALAASATAGLAASKSELLPIEKAFDREMEAFMAARKIPGGALAVVKDRRLVYARGYGWANRETKLPARPESLFRIASISKPITGVAMLKLVQDGKVKLDDKAFPLLNIMPAVMSFRDPEPRLRDITIRQLLQHTGGWDIEKSFDPMFRSTRIARATNTPPPASPLNIIRYMLSRTLDFAPGTRYGYSNYGYCVLGRVIEKLTGQSYEAFVRDSVLAPAGIKQMRLGATQEGKQAPGEVRYYTARASLTESVFPDISGEVPEPYGGFHLEAMDAHGGWIASVIDLARFAAALDEPERSPLLNPETFAAMYAPPPPPVSRTADGKLEPAYYACGWMVRPVKDGRANYWHAGGMPGTTGLLVRRWDGLSWAVLFNQRSPDDAIDPALHRAAGAVAKWPEHDLFSTFN